MTALADLSEAELQADIERLLDEDRAEHSTESPGALADWLTAGQEMSARHLDLIDEALQKAAAGTVRKVLITMPPRRGKSRRAARWAPLWYLRKFPRRRVVVASYGADLADEHGRWVRDMIQEYSGRHGSRDLGLRLDRASEAANRWDLISTEVGDKGGMRTVGVGGALTGRGAHLLIVDDPIKDAETADSPLYRRRLWNWWTQVALPRLEPGGVVIVIQTRWHKEDLAGQLLKQQDEEANPDDDPWLVLNLPELAEDRDPEGNPVVDLLGRKPGEPLWPERFSLAEDIRTRRNVGERSWNALYQQHPRPLEGVLWKEPWISDNRWRASWGVFDINLCQRIVTGVDPSGTAGGDEAGIVTSGVGFRDEPCPCGSDAPLPHLYVLADGSGQFSPEGWARRALREYRAWDADAVVAETNFGADMVKSNLRAVDVNLPVVEVHASRGKAVRAEPVATLYQQGRAHHVGKFPELEGEQLNWRPDARWSPNRLDALVWDAHELVLGDATRVKVLA